MNRKILFVVVATLLSAVISAGDCKAQRHVPGQSVMSVELQGWERFGGSFFWGKSGYRGHSIFGASFFTGLPEPYDVPATKDTVAFNHKVVSNDYYVSGGYLFRVCSNRSRSVNLLLGGTLDLGIRDYVDEKGMYGIPSVKFIYGVSPIAKFEYFPVDAFALNIHFRPRFQLYGHKVFEKWFYPQFGIGCTLYLF